MVKKAYTKESEDEIRAKKESHRASKSMDAVVVVIMPLGYM